MTAKTELGTIRCPFRRVADPGGKCIRGVALCQAGLARSETGQGRVVRRVLEMNREDQQTKMNRPKGRLEIGLASLRIVCVEASQKANCRSVDQVAADMSKPCQLVQLSLSFGFSNQRSGASDCVLKPGFRGRAAGISMGFQ